MQILHFKLCDLNLTFKGNKSSKILRLIERLYMTSSYVFLIDFSYSMLRLYEKQSTENSMTLIWPYNAIQGQVV